jgi:CRISPR/Cas system-associated protein endoribonuclease Cas2
MKIPLTDKFLLMLYDFYEATDRFLEPPEIFKLRSMREIGVDLHFWEELKRKKRRRQFHQFVDYLKRSGYIKIENLQGRRGILLTPKGRQKALRAKFRSARPRGLKKRKDRKWIMIIFDIPERKRKYRDDFKEFLYSLGFQALQKSVWISPYEVSRELEEIVRIYRIDAYIRTFLIEEVEI